MADALGSRPHVLLVAWAFPPMAGGGTYRTLATANALSEIGFDVTVLTAEREAFLGFAGLDPALEARIRPDVEVVRIPFLRPRFDFDIRHWPKERAEDPPAWSERFREHEVDDFPEPHFGQWFRPLIAAAEQVQRRKPVDLVIGSANPHVVLAVGDHLHTRFGVPYVIDHRDAWRLNCYLGTERKTEEPRVAALETRYVEAAQEIWFVNEPIREWHQALYPQAADRMRVVENGFDGDFAPAPHLEAPPADRPLTFTYVGMIGPRVPVAETVDGWLHARTLSHEVARARADIFGSLPPHDWWRLQLLTEAADYGLHYRGPLPKADVPAIYAGSDVLLLILASGRYVTSGKVYEYLATGLPIVSVHEPGNGAADVLREYPLWFPAEDLSVHAVADALLAAARASRTAGSQLRRESAAFGRDQERSRRLRQPVKDLYESVLATKAVRR